MVLRATAERLAPLFVSREKARSKVLRPVVQWQVDPKLESIFADRDQRVAVGSIVAAGHMPVGFAEDDVLAIGLTKNHVETLSQAQIEELRVLKLARAQQKNPQAQPTPFRFLDTYENIHKQEDRVYRDLKKVYEGAKKDGATKVLFSVCAISAGFDLNYSNALLKLMKEEGYNNFIFSIYLPFNKDSVTNYSVGGQGINPEHWTAQWTKLQEEAALHPGSIFIHEPKLKDQPNGTSPDHNTAHQRGQEVNGDVNSVYSDVNRMLVFEALRATSTNVVDRGDVATWNPKKVRGIFAEAFQASNALLGGGPEIMAMLLYAGVPLRNLDILKEGLTDVKRFGRTRMLLKYYKDFFVLLDEWNKNEQVASEWGNKRLRRTSTR